MKEKFLTILLILTLCLTCVSNIGSEVKAADSAVEESYSVFRAVDALVAQADVNPCGVYLGSGQSFIEKISTTKVGVGGTTAAAVKCKVSCNSVLEQLVDGSWVRWDSWTTTVASGYSASVDESDTVTRGYYYRVRSLHHASSDTSSSCTSSLWMQ